MRIQKLICAATVVIVAGLAAACNGRSPVAPSVLENMEGTRPQGPSQPGTATVLGVVTSGSHTGAPGVMPAGLIVSVVGTEIMSTIDSAGRFELSGVPSGSPQLRFAGAGIDATATVADVGDQEVVEIAVRIQGNSAIVETAAHSPPGHNKIEIEGLIGSIAPETRLIEVRGSMVSVPESAVIRHGARLLTFVDLHVGDRVHVRALTNADPTLPVVATEVKLQNPVGPDDEEEEEEEEGEEAEIKGTVDSTSGDCPSLTFVVDGTTVHIGSDTEFKKSSCDDIQPGASVEVEGLLQADDSILAQKIEVEEQDDEEGPAQTRIEGTVDSTSGDCPSLTFVVDGTTVHVGSATRFKKSSCDDIQPGASVEVQGVLQADDSILARRIEVEEDEDDEGEDGEEEDDEEDDEEEEEDEEEEDDEHGGGNGNGKGKGKNK